MKWLPHLVCWSSIISYRYKKRRLFFVCDEAQDILSTFIYNIQHELYLSYCTLHRGTNLSCNWKLVPLTTFCHHTERWHFYWLCSGLLYISFSWLIYFFSHFMYCLLLFKFYHLINQCLIIFQFYFFKQKYVLLSIFK